MYNEHHRNDERCTNIVTFTKQWDVNVKLDENFTGILILLSFQTVRVILDLLIDRFNDPAVRRRALGLKLKFIGGF